MYFCLQTSGGRDWNPSSLYLDTRNNVTEPPQGSWYNSNTLHGVRCSMFCRTYLKQINFLYINTWYFHWTQTCTMHIAAYIFVWDMSFRWLHNTTGGQPRPICNRITSRFFLIPSNIANKLKTCQSEAWSFGVEETERKLRSGDRELKATSNTSSEQPGLTIIFT